MILQKNLLLAASFLFVLASACVKRTKYDAQVKLAREYKAQADDCEAKKSEQSRRIGSLKTRTVDLDRLGKTLSARLEKCNKDAAEAMDRMKQLDTELTGLKKMLQSYQAMTSKYKGSSKKRQAELKRLQQEILALQKHFTQRMQATRRELAELSKARAEAEKRARMYRDLTRQFRKLIDAGTLTVGLVHGRMVIQMGSAILFDSGKAELKPTGRQVLDKVADVLKTIGDRHFQVAGHTDDRPIRLSRYRSNWDLSVARALDVVKYLEKRGVPSQSLSAGGYSQYQPVASNRTQKGRRSNRRIEITLMPTIPKNLLRP